jgi:hypothetical protein
VRPGDVVVTMTYSGPPVLVVLLAAAALGARWVPVAVTPSIAHLPRYAVLLATDCLRQADGSRSIVQELVELASADPARPVVLIPTGDPDAYADGLVEWGALFAHPADLPAAHGMPGHLLDHVAQVSGRPLSQRARRAVEAVVADVTSRDQIVVGVRVPVWDADWLVVPAALCAGSAVLLGDRAFDLGADTMPARMELTDALLSAVQ